MNFQYKLLPEKQQVEIYNLWQQNKHKDILKLLKKHNIISCTCVGFKACVEWLEYCYENNIWKSGEPK